MREGEPVMLTADNVRRSVDGSMAFIGECTLPWEGLEFTGPEAACLAADARIGPAIMRSSVPLDVIGPNVDLSLRFTTAPATRVIQAASMVLSIQHGTATVGLELHAPATSSSPTDWQPRSCCSRRESAWKADDADDDDPLRRRWDVEQVGDVTGKGLRSL